LGRLREDCRGRRIRAKLRVAVAFEVAREGEHLGRHTRDLDGHVDRLLARSFDVAT